jgi:transposase-like protein
LKLGSVFVSSTQPKQKRLEFNQQLINQLLSGSKTAGETEDLLKDLRKAFIESALDGELTHLLGYEKHDAALRARDDHP